MSNATTVSQLTVDGFEYLRSSVPVDPQDALSLASADYVGQLQLPYIAVVANGKYNSATERIIFNTALELTLQGLTLLYTVEVDLQQSKIVASVVTGHLGAPVNVDVTGQFNAGDCTVDLSGSVDSLPEFTISAAVSLQFDSSCNVVQSADSVEVSLNLLDPFNVFLNGSYSLQKDAIVTDLQVDGMLVIEEVVMNVSTTVLVSGNGSIIQDINLSAVLPLPISSRVTGTYSRITGLVSFSGIFLVSPVLFSVRLSANVAARSLSELELFGNILTPFSATLSGKYSIGSQSSELSATGTIAVPGISVAVTGDINLDNRSFTQFRIKGEMSEPVMITVAASYHSLPTDQLVLMGNLSLPDNMHSISLAAVLAIANDTRSLSLDALEVSGVFPPPLSFISFSGIFNSTCSCALLSGQFMQTEYVILMSTNLVFPNNESLKISSMEVVLLISVPADLQLEGSYVYSGLLGDSSTIGLNGELVIPEFTFSTSVQLILMGMNPSSVNISGIHFEARLQAPLEATLIGAYNIGEQEVFLGGMLTLTFASLNATLGYHFENRARNMSAFLTDLSLVGNLNNPFSLQIQGLYSFEMSQFSLSGTVVVNEYLILNTDLSLNTATSPVSIETVAFSGNLMTPIEFGAEFAGIFLPALRQATLESSLEIGGAMFAATSNLTVDNSSSFSLQSIEISGMLSDPLSFDVLGTYMPGNVSVLILSGTLMLGEFTFTGSVLAETNEMTGRVEVSRVDFAGILDSPFMLQLTGQYVSGDTLSLSGLLDFTELQLIASAVVNLTANPRNIQSIQFVGQLNSPFTGSVEANYQVGSGELVLNGSIDLASLQFDVEVYFNTSTPVHIRQMLFMTTYDPLNLLLQGEYDRQQQSLDLSGTISIPSVVDVSATANIDLSGDTRSLSALQLTAELQEPPTILRGIYNATSETASLSGDVSLAGLNITTAALLEVQVNGTGERTTSLSTIELSGVFPSPLDFISFHGTYNRACSCAVIAGNVDGDGYSLTVRTNLTVASNQSTSITLVEVDLVFSSPLNLNLNGVYHFSDGAMANVIDLSGGFMIPQISFVTTLQLIINDTMPRSIELSQLRFAGMFQHPLGLTVAGVYDGTLERMLLSGNLDYSFADLNASVVYQFADQTQNVSSGLTDVTLTGSLTDPFQLMVQGTYSFESGRFTLAGTVVVSDYLTLTSDLSLNTSTSPVSLEFIALSGNLTTPIEFGAEFAGIFQPALRQATLESILEIGGAMFAAAGNLTVDDSSSFSLQSIEISGMLSDPLSFDVLGTYMPGNVSVLILSGTLMLGEFTFTGSVLAKTNAMTGRVEVSRVDFAGTLDSPFTLQLTGQYVSGDTLSLSGLLDITELQLTASVVVNLTANPRNIQSIHFVGQLNSPFTGSVEANYQVGSGELVLNGSIDLASLQFDVEVYFNTSTPVHIRQMLFMTTYDPLNLLLQGEYDRQQQSLDLSGTISIPSVVDVSATANIDLSGDTRSLSALQLTAELQEPPTILRGIYNATSETASLSGDVSLAGLNITTAALLEVQVNGTGERMASLSAIELSGVFPSPLDFISFHGTYNSACSCAVIAGNVDGDGYSLTVRTNLTVASNQSTSITSVEVDVVFSSPLNLNLNGVYHFSDGAMANVIDLSGEFMIPQISFVTTLQLIINDTMPRNIELSQLRFAGMFQHPLGLTVAGVYDGTLERMLLSGNLDYSFADLNASVVYQFADQTQNVSSGLTDVTLTGSLTDPFQLMVQGTYSFESGRFTLAGTVVVSDYLTLTSDLSLNTSTSPVSLEFIALSGNLTTPIEFGAEFAGIFQPTLRQATLESTLEIGGAMFAAAGNLTVDDSSSFSLQSIEISGMLSDPLSFDVLGTYMPGNVSVLILSGTLVLGELSFTGSVLAETNEMTGRVEVSRVDFAGTLDSPFTLQLTGQYVSGDTLSLSGLLDFTELQLTASVVVNLTANPRNIQSIHFVGQLNSPFTGSVEANYQVGSGELVLNGSIDLASLQFDVAVYFNTTTPVHIRQMLFTTTYDPLNLLLQGEYDRQQQSLDLSGTISIPSVVDVSATANIDLSGDTRSLSALQLTAELQEPPTILRGIYNATSETASLSGDVSLAGLNITTAALLEVQVNGTGERTTSLSTIELSGVFPSPLDFISFRGTYNRACSCAVITGNVDGDGYSLTVQTNLTVASNQSTSITSVEVDLVFSSPLNLNLQGVYHFSDGAMANVIDLSGEFMIPQISFVTTLQLIINDSMPRSIELSQLRFAGMFQPPLGLTVAGVYDGTLERILLSGFLDYSFVDLNASLVYQFADQAQNVSSGLTYVTLTGSLTDPFQLMVQGTYSFESGRFTLTGTVVVSDYLTLTSDLSLNTSTSPVSLEFIALSGNLTTPIEFGAEFAGIFQPALRQATLESTLEIGGAMFAASGNLSVDSGSSFSLQSIEISGMLSDPLSFDVLGTYMPGNVSVLILSGTLMLGEFTFTGSVLAETNEMTGRVEVSRVDFAGTLDSPFTLQLTGQYVSGDTLSLSGLLDFTELQLTASVVVNLTANPRNIQSIHFVGQLNSPFTGSVEANYQVGSGELVLNGSIDLASLQFDVAVYFNTTTPVHIRQMLFTTTYDPLNLLLQGEYDRQQQSLDLSGTISIPSVVDVSATANIDLSGDTRSLSALQLTAELQEPPTILRGIYNATSETASLSGDVSLAGLNITTAALLEVQVNGTGERTTSLSTIELSGVFPSPLDFISFRGTYNRACSCAVITGNVDGDGYSLTVQTNLTVASNQSTSITSVEVDVVFSSPLNLNLQGVYHFSDGAMANVIDLSGEFMIPQISFVTTLQLIINDSMPRSIELSQLRFAGMFQPPLGLTVAGVYDGTFERILLSGFLDYSFVDLNASLVYQFADQAQNVSSGLTDVTLTGSLTDPFQLMVQGAYSFDSGRFTLTGTVVVSDYLTLTSDLSLNTSTSPVSLEFIALSGNLTTPIEFGAEFAGIFQPALRQATLESTLEIGGAMFAASGNLSVDSGSSFSLQSIEISGMLSDPLSFDVLGTYMPGNVSVLILSGTLMLGEFTFTGSVLAETNEMTDRVEVSRVDFAGTLDSPFTLQLTGQYVSGDTLSLSGLLDFTELQLTASAVVNLTANPRNIQSIQFVGQLNSPFTGSVEVNYQVGSGELVLNGSIDLASLQFDMEVYFNTTTQVHIRQMLFATTYNPLNLLLQGEYDRQQQSLDLSGTISIPSIVDVSATANIDLSGDTRSLSALQLTAELQEPPTILRGIYNATSETASLSGDLSLAGLSITTTALFEVQVNGTGERTTSLSAIELSGVFPSPLDFISFHGTYNSACSCAVIAGNVDGDGYSLTVRTNLTVASNQSTSITSVEVDVVFSSPLNLNLQGVYHFSDGAMANVIDLSGEFMIPQISFVTTLQLIINNTMPRSIELSQLRFAGMFQPPLGLTVAGVYDGTLERILLSGFLGYSFADLNASVVYQFADQNRNVSSGLIDVAFMGSLTDPFQLMVEGNYSFVSAMFALAGSIQVSDYLTLSAVLLLNTTTSPVSVATVQFSGTLMTPIEFESEFSGQYEAAMKSAELQSTLQVASVVFQATGVLTVEGGSTFSLQSIAISGELPSPLSINVNGSYVPGNRSELSLTGTLIVGTFTFTGTIFAERTPPPMKGVDIKRVEFSGTVDDPFSLIFGGEYVNGDLLLLNASLDLTELFLAAAAQVNLTSQPRAIQRIMFSADLKDPFTGTVQADYTLGSNELVLEGMLDLASLQFELAVYMDTGTPVSVSRMQFTTTFDPLNLKLVGLYDRDAAMINLFGVISLPASVNITAGASISLAAQMRSLSSLQLSADIQEPPVRLSGIYNETANTALLAGSLSFSSVNFSACALLLLDSPRRLEEIGFSTSFTIPFGDMLVFFLSGTYKSATRLIVVEGSIGRTKRDAERMLLSPAHSLVERSVSGGGASGDIISAVLILSTVESPSFRVIGLNLPDIDIAELVDKYIGISWPASLFPLSFTDIVIYSAAADLTYDGITYSEGFHARGTVTIYMLPTLILEASLVTEPERRFGASVTLTEALEYSLFAVCGSNDMTCTQTGPSIGIQVGGGSSVFSLAGGFRLFDVVVGSIDLTVGNTRMDATITLTKEVTDRFNGLVPMEISVYWNNKGFYTSLPIPSLELPDFKFDNVATADICRSLGRAIAEFAIDAPFNLMSHVLVDRDNESNPYFALIINGTVELNLAGQTAVTVTINPLSYSAKLPVGEPLSWTLFAQIVEQLLKDSAQETMNGILRNPDALALIAAGRAGQLAAEQASRQICNRLLMQTPPSMTTTSPNVNSPTPRINPARLPQIPSLGASAGATSSFLSGVSSSGIGIGSVGAAALCAISSLFGGGCGGDDDGGDDGGGGAGVGGDIGGGFGSNNQALTDLTNALGLSCDTNNGNCDHICQQSTIFFQMMCSCRDGYYLATNGRSCIRKLQCITNLLLLFTLYIFIVL